MNLIAWGSALLLILASGQAMATDAPASTKAPAASAPPVSADGLDYAFGVKLQSNYLSRGITQSDHKPGVTAYGELRYNVSDSQFYAGLQPWSVKLPSRPAAEIDLYGGIRQTFGPVVVDAGAIYYEYPHNTRQYFGNGPVTALLPFVGSLPLGAKNPSYYEVYAKPVYTVNDIWTIGANFFYSPNYQNVRARDFYGSGTLKINLPANFSVSGELGYQYLGTTSATYGPVTYKSYTTWNLGVSYVYKVATLDLRYSGSNLSKSNCYLDASDPKGNMVGQVASMRSHWCDQRVMASLSIDITSKDLK